MAQQFSAPSGREFIFADLVGFQMLFMNVLALFVTGEQVFPESESHGSFGEIDGQRHLTGRRNLTYVEVLW